MVIRWIRQGMCAAAMTTLIACQSIEPAQDDVSTAVATAVVATHRANADRARPDGTRPSTARPSESPLVPTYDTVWQRMADNLSLYAQYDHPSIDSELAWYLENKDFFTTVAERATPFLHWILDEVERRGLPLDLALLPVVESGFNPGVSSSQRAAGLWQFMGATANTFGMQRDVWYDARLDPLESTRYALDYLQALHDQFDGDWLLALAAYNAGEGNVRRALNRAGNEADFWDLRLPRETRVHVPRFLAVARLFANPDAYGLTLPPLPNAPYIAVLDPGFQVDMGILADATGVDPLLLRRLNPGYRQWATHPDGPHRLVVPQELAESLSQQLANLPPTQRMIWDQYVIQPGDSLSAIAARTGVDVPSIMAANALPDSRIIAGATLRIPRQSLASGALPLLPSTAEVKSPAPPAYRVRPGDSLWAIARRFDLRSADIASWNGLDLEAVLKPGQTLILQGAESVATTEADTAQSTPQVYRVRRGDSLSSIARRHGVSVQDLLDWNEIEATSLIHPGQELVLSPTPAEIN